MQCLVVPPALILLTPTTHVCFFLKSIVEILEYSEEMPKICQWTGKMVTSRNDNLFTVFLANLQNFKLLHFFFHILLTHTFFQYSKISTSWRLLGWALWWSSCDDMAWLLFRWTSCWPLMPSNGDLSSVASFPMNSAPLVALRSLSLSEWKSLKLIAISLFRLLQYILRLLKFRKFQDNRWIK